MSFTHTTTVFTFAMDALKFGSHDLTATKRPRKNQAPPGNTLSMLSLALNLKRKKIISQIQVVYSALRFPQAQARSVKVVISYHSTKNFDNECVRLDTFDLGLDFFRELHNSKLLSDLIHFIVKIFLTILLVVGYTHLSMSSWNDYQKLILIRLREGVPHLSLLFPMASITQRILNSFITSLEFFLLFPKPLKILTLHFFTYK